MAGVTAALSAAPVRLGGGGGLDLSLSRIAVSLILCLVLAAAVILLMRRRGGAPALSRLRGFAGPRLRRRIDVLESRRISAHADLCLVRCDDRDWLILSSATVQQVLHQAPAPRADIHIPGGTDA